MLGTIVKFKVYGKKAEKAICEAVDKLNEIDDKMSAFKDYSEILKGTFDITVRPLVNLWGVGTDKEDIPSTKDIEETLKLVNYKDIIFEDEFKSVMLRQKKQAIDLGGIAKGYAADCVRNIFKKNKIESGIIDLGGNVFVLGKKNDGSLWNVGIQDPVKERGKFVGIVSAKNKSIVTSGNYEKFFVKDGIKYHHIIDPKTGYPSESKIISATIISDNSIDGDGLSTGVYILGVDKAMKLIEHMEGIDAIFITEDKKIYVTSGAKKNFAFSNKEYTYVNK